MSHISEVPLSKHVRDRRFNELLEKRQQREAKIAAARGVSVPTGSVGSLGSTSLESSREQLLARAAERRTQVEQGRALSEQDRRLIRRMTAALEENTAVMRQVHGLTQPADEAQEESFEAEGDEDSGAATDAPEAS